MAIMHSDGATVILDITSTTTGPGTAYQVLPRHRDLVYQCIQAGTSAGVTVTATVNVDVSNDGSNWAGAVGTTMTINGATPQNVISRIASSLDGPYQWVRANVTACSSTTTASTGYRIQVFASGRPV